MSHATISAISAQEILDSRGHPTISVTLRLADGRIAVADVPSGASTGRREAVELRDGDADRFDGKGVLRAVTAITTEISDRLAGMDVTDQQAIDQALITLDGTPNKSRLGANALIGVSMAVARAAALARGLPLYQSLGSGIRLPMPCMNVLNGGKHADSSLDFQEFMIVPVGAPTFAEAMRYGVETYAAIRAILHERGLATSVGDEGGFAPRLEDNEAACALIVEATERAGFRPARDIAIALDPAASSFAQDGGYALERSGGGRLDSGQLLGLYAGWIDRWPIVSIEDGFSEDDWDGFVAQTSAQGQRIQIVGDDLLVTDPATIAKAIERKACTAALIKLNQIGTVSETLAAIDTAQTAGWGTMISHRSGETIDSFIADLSVGTSAGQIKSGAPCRGERLAKYNRLMAIESKLGERAVFENPFIR